MIEFVLLELMSALLLLVLLQDKILKQNGVKYPALKQASNAKTLNIANDYGLWGEVEEMMRVREACKSTSEEEAVRLIRCDCDLHIPISYNVAVVVASSQDDNEKRC
eukprot:GHVU01199036.1.p1 GENE.GHVU01199036.1~~GHVU01199036.1.p1  ORF type:complete len:107 (+),score=12.81 GHVU01199036.1:283-603(+)